MRILSSLHPLLCILSVSLVLSFLLPSMNCYSDLDVLLKLKASMSGPGGSGLQDWRTGSPPFPTVHCSFPGVVCDEDSRVVSLQVSDVPLFGTLPSEIGLLNKLVNLTLTSVNLTGELPHEMWNLTSIKFINLSDNTFGGVFPGKIVASMIDLEVFDVYNNNFTGNLPTEFAKLKKLKILKLSGNYFSGEIPEAYSEFPVMEILALQGNGLSGKIPASLSKLSNLQYLYLGYYNSYDGGIPPEFGSLSSLRLLDLGNCNLTGEIPASLGNLKYVHSLFFQLNNLTGQLPSELSGLVSLMSFDVSLNALTGEIPASFAKLTNLTLFNLFGNHFYGPLPSFIGDLPNLEVLEIWQNNFTFELPENLGRNGKLYRLDVATNHLTGTIPRDLCKGGRLETLILMDNYFFGHIPEELGHCKSLTRIRLKRNFFNGSIPAGFFNLPELILLELNDNFFTSELPAAMSADKLETLTLSNNWITGNIPPAIGNLAMVGTLLLETNRLSGEIPAEISNLRELLEINLSANSLVGEIPGSVVSCIKLTSIDLSRNNLQGEIPKDFFRLRNLNTLNLSRNQLSGVIPIEMGSLSGLTILDLSYNGFSGRRPINGQLKYFGDNSFVGNPNLCLSHSPICPSLGSPTGSSHNGRNMLGMSKLVATLIILVTVVLLLVVTYGRLKKKRLLDSRIWRLTAFQKLDFKAEDVLDCLRTENIIGKGGAGIVYRGSMPNGVEVAIKQLINRGSGRNDHGFSAEIQILGRIRHRYIVRLLGYVSNKDANLLLYEYMANGSLGEILHGSKGAHLQWETRYMVALEAAKGLCYLHHDCSPPILHRDVKSNNILLDSDYEAHVADFGLAKFLQDADASECMSSVAGSYGYIAPEYAYTLKVDEKSDVYSFGVVLLELITGRKPVGEFGEGVDIVRWVRKTISEIPQPTDAPSVLAIVDQRLSNYSLTSVINLFKIAMLCVEDESHARPTMREVVHMLSNPSQTAPDSAAASPNLITL